MARFREVFKNRNFLLLWLGQIVSQFGDRLNQMALIALIYARFPGSTLQLAKVLSFTILPVFLVGPIAAAYVDRWDRRRTMIVCDLLRCVLVALIAFCFIQSKSLWPLYSTIFLIFSVGRFSVPAKMAFIPELVSPEKLLLANSLASTTGMIAAVAGFGLGGLVVEHAGSYGGFLIDALTYLISSILIFMIAVKLVPYFTKAQQPQGVLSVQKILKKTLIADIKEGWQYLAKDADVRLVARIFFLLWAAVGAIYVVIIVFVQNTLGSVTKDLGILAMFLGTGLFLGSLLYGRFGQKVSRMRVIFISLGLAGVVLCLFTAFLKLFASHLFACGISLVLGMTLAPAVISAQTLVHEVAQQNMHGRVFSALDIVAYLGFFLFMLISSFVAERIDRFWILLFVGIVFVIVGFGAIILKIDRKRLLNV